ncbi:3-coathanger stack domain-containing protein [Emticicia sp. BO119]|uniref:3-coathanger stack domain-containing protein n=1 Tax=Emticicia sp. BO119 TaxID=2757768 RepID=UPI0015F01586|nr:3-coathanger stack domain-containing protein [Emticicia sp. BO119]MBA4850661.1 hypothetical protein [Emticicia sp. BO119]
MTKKLSLIIISVFLHFTLFGQEYSLTTENGITPNELEYVENIGTDSIPIYAEIPPKPILTSDRDIICDGSYATLVATGCNGTIIWNTGFTGTIMIVSAGGTFSAICTNQSGASEPSHPIVIRQFFLPEPPTVRMSSPITCEDRTKTLIASGCNEGVIWNSGATQSSITVSVSGTYVAACVSICGTSASSNLVVVRFLFPFPFVMAENTGPYQTGESIHLNGWGTGRRLVWTGPNEFMEIGDSIKILNAKIAESGVYTLTVTDNDGCSKSDTTHVIVKPCSEKLRFSYVSTEPDLRYLFSLKDGMILKKFPFKTGILATPVCQLDTSIVGSIRMQMSGPESFYNRDIIENVYPYSILSNNGFQIFGSVFPIGEYTLTFTAYSQISGQGDVLFGPQMVHFTIVDSLVTINLDSLNITEICPGAPLTISFTGTGNFPADNLFEVQLSDEGGSFENPIKIGESMSGSLVQCSIPLNVSPGDAYRVRVYSTKPAQISNTSFESFKIKARKIDLQNPDDNINSIVNREASEIIKASNKIQLNARASYHTGRYILLTPGFEVHSGAIFNTQIVGCF